jgi:UMF1 family MFS transporter
MPDAPPVVAVRDVPKTIWSWGFFDWANSAFTTLIVTFVYATYFTGAFAPTKEVGTQWWGWAVSGSAILIALLSPVLGAAADRAGARKLFLGWSVVLCAAGTVALAFVTPSGGRSAAIALTIFALANVAFEVGMVFYNSFLPEIASQEKIGRVSGYGWGLGYVGGLLCMAVALVGFVGFPGVDALLGITKEGAWHVRSTNFLVAGWFLLFALPFFRNIPESRRGPVTLDVMGSFRELRNTYGHILRYPQTFRFLLARLVFNDGLVTIFAFGAIYASGTFGMNETDVLLFGITLNVASGLGAFAFGFVDDRVGGKQTIMMTLLLLSMAAMVAVWAPTVTWFWAAGIMIGLFVGPNQSASRSLMGRFVPEKHQAEFFGFFAFSGKATAFMGPLLLGWATATFASQRAGVGTVLVFFAIGGVLLARVDEPAGIAAARAG